MIGKNDEIQYSTVLVFRSRKDGKNAFGIYPNVVQNTATIQVETEKTGAGIIQFVDYPGRVLLQKNVLLQEGTNNLTLDNLSGLRKGNYIVMLKLNNKTYTEKIINQ